MSDVRADAIREEGRESASRLWFLHTAAVIGLGLAADALAVPDSSAPVDGDPQPAG